ncbi:MAG TPA: multidrug ABC transporter ATP-binding protein, partial [Ruminococcaceae bacterium]|nr:multidrug ABC transporter ATP-binding protein [Oscillospiraceae bacterium]
VNSVSKMLSNGILNFILDIFNIVFITIFMFSENVTLSFVILAGMPLLMAGLWSVKAMQRRAWQSESNKNSNLNAYLNESINGMKITQLFVREKVNHEIFSNQAKAVSFAWQKAVALNQLVPFFAENISQWVMSFVYIAGMLWMYPTVTIGTLIAMGDYARRFWQPINRLAQIYNEFINTIAYLERIFETIDEPVTIADAADAYPLPPINGDVEFKNVSFAYEEGVNVLENLSFKVKAGESVALVGPTGAGKTTIVNLISRFYDVTAGEVLIDGNNISKVTLNSLRSQMGIMLQDSFIFSGTIADNIRFGKLDATQEEIEKACKTVFAHDFILQTEKGYETEVNERGSRLSQGQKQLLSFARTLISNPKILVLDEATAAIDAKTEKYVQKGINELLKGRTSFIIAHRLSTIKNCDKIMYISDKNIAECGTHDELIAKKGEYYRLYTSQLSEM